MQFRKIWFDGAKVQLEWEEQLAGGAVDRHAFDCAEGPTPAFKNALQAFAPFATNLLALPDDWNNSVVRSLSIKREQDTGARGLQVTIMRPIPKARNRPVVLTTPYLAEAPADHTGPIDGFLSSTVIDLVANAENEAALYRQGERGDQIKMDLGDDNIKGVNDRMAAAEVASTRKPRARTPKAGETGVDFVVNEPGDQLTDDALRQLLLSVERDVPVGTIGVWTSSDRDAAHRWAVARQKELIGQLVATHVPVEPECVIKCATLPLKADESSPAPRAPDGAAIDDLAKRRAGQGKKAAAKKAPTRKGPRQ